MNLRTCGGIEDGRGDAWRTKGGRGCKRGEERGGMGGEKSIVKKVFHVCMSSLSLPGKRMDTHCGLKQKEERTT